MKLLKWLFGWCKPKFNKSIITPSLNTSWSEIWIDWLKTEKHKTDVTFSLWLQEHYEVPRKK